MNWRLQLKGKLARGTDATFAWSELFRIVLVCLGWGGKKVSRAGSGHGCAQDAFQVSVDSTLIKIQCALIPTAIC